MMRRFLSPTTSRVWPRRSSSPKSALFTTTSSTLWPATGFTGKSRSAATTPTSMVFSLTSLFLLPKPLVRSSCLTCIWSPEEVCFTLVRLVLVRPPSLRTISLMLTPSLSKPPALTSTPTPTLRLSKSSCSLLLRNVLVRSMVPQQVRNSSSSWMTLTCLRLINTVPNLLLLCADRSSITVLSMTETNSLRDLKLSISCLLLA
mmetsp:Transcript_116895/g.162398  ORF Transcript_116895/g.162398 Transcript_116895/m.162398 type:complete len:203 (+) Transcript_116895:4187-4795(+)